MNSNNKEPYIPNIATDFPTIDEESKSSHPLVRAEPGFAGEIVKVRYQAGHDVCKPGIVTLRVNTDGVGGNVVDGEV